MKERGMLNKAVILREKKMYLHRKEENGITSSSCTSMLALLNVKLNAVESLTSITLTCVKLFKKLNLDQIYFLCVFTLYAL